MRHFPFIKTAVIIFAGLLLLGCHSSSNTAPPKVTNYGLLAKAAAILPDSLQRLRTAADDGNDIAQYYLGKLYANGAAVPQDYIEAAILYKKSMQHGNARAQGALAHLYREGWGVEQDSAQSQRLYAEIHNNAKKGNPRAQFALGLLYQSGGGPIKKSRKKARHWLTKSAK